MIRYTYQCFFHCLLNTDGCKGDSSVGGRDSSILLTVPL